MALHLRKAEKALPDVGSDIRMRLDGDPDKRTLETRVEQVDAKRRVLVIRSPSYNGETVHVTPGRKVAITWMDRLGDFLLVLVVVAVQEGRVPRWVLRAVGPAQYAQRRSFVRVEMVGRLELNIGTQVVRAALLDMSEGGFRCAVGVHERLETGQMVTGRLKVGKGREIPFLAEVMRTVDRHSPSRVEAGLRFVDMAEQDTEEIRHYLFEVMREQRRRSS